MLRTALTLVALAALPACATGPGGWQDSGWRDDALDPWSAHAPYPAAAGWWGGPPPTAAAFGPYLAGHGRWVGYGNYGRVWLPSVGPGWQPYRFGNWIEHPRWGRTWRSAEPFGWITYHYGRWGFDPRLGWFWVPGFAFAPHWADVRWSGSWLGWAPLPPPGWSGWGGWRWGAGGWGHGYPGWVYSPRGGAHRPGGTPRNEPDRDEFDRMVRAPAPAIAQVTPVAPPVVAQPSPPPPTWTRDPDASGNDGQRPAWQARTRGRDLGNDRGDAWQAGALPPETRRQQRAAMAPPEAVAVRPGLVAPAVTERPARTRPEGSAPARSERSAPPARPPAVRGGLEQGASASEP